MSTVGLRTGSQRREFGRGYDYAVDGGRRAMEGTGVNRAGASDNDDMGASVVDEAGDDDGVAGSGSGSDTDTVGVDGDDGGGWARVGGAGGGSGVVCR